MQVADEALHRQTRFMDAKLQKVRTQQVIVIHANVWLDEVRLNGHRLFPDPLSHKFRNGKKEVMACLGIYNAPKQQFIFIYISCWP